MFFSHILQAFVINGGKHVRDITVTQYSNHAEEFTSLACSVKPEMLVAKIYFNILGIYHMFTVIIFSDLYSHACIHTRKSWQADFFFVVIVLAKCPPSPPFAKFNDSQYFMLYSNCEYVLLSDMATTLDLG